MSPRHHAFAHALCRRRVLLLLAACGSSEPEAVAFEPLNVAAAPSFASGESVFTTAAAWHAACFAVPQQFHADPFNLQHAPQPEVDFSVHNVVDVSLGVGTRCFVPRIRAVMRLGDTLDVCSTAPTPTPWPARTPGRWWHSPRCRRCRARCAACGSRAGWTWGRCDAEEPRRGVEALRRCEDVAAKPRPLRPLRARASVGPDGPTSLQRFVLASRRGTHCTPCGRFVRTTATGQLTKRVSTRAAARPKHLRRHPLTARSGLSGLGFGRQNWRSTEWAAQWVAALQRLNAHLRAGCVPARHARYPSRPVPNIGVRRPECASAVGPVPGLPVMWRVHLDGVRFGFGRRVS
jgi:hypothetical protein